MGRAAIPGRALVAIGVLLALGACAHSPPQPDPRDAGRSLWRTITTEHFEIYAQWDEANTRGLAQVLEQARAALLATVWPQASMLPNAPVRVIAAWGLGHFAGNPPYQFGGDTSWRVDLRELGPSNFITLNLHAQSFDNAGFTAAHEVAHLINDLPKVSLPRWLHEGLAAYHEAMSFSPGAVQVGGLSPGRVRSMRATRYRPVAELFHWSEPINEAELYSSFSNHSLLLVHFLLSQDPDRFRAMQRRLLQGAAWQDAWNDSYGPLDVLALDQQLVDYATRAAWRTRRVPVALVTPGAWRVRLVSEADIHALHGLLYQIVLGPMPAAERAAHAREEIARSLALDPGNPLAVEAGWTSFRPPEQRAHALEAARTRPGDWRSAILAARASDADAGVVLLEAALRRNPGHAYLEAALALAYWRDLRYDEARTLARRAVDRDPGDPHLLGVYGQCLIARNRCEGGREVVAEALAGVARGQRFPYDLIWLTRVCRLE